LEQTAKYILLLDDNGFPVTPAKMSRAGFQRTKDKETLVPNDDSNADNDNNNKPDETEDIAEEDEYGVEEATGWTKDVVYEGVDTDALFENEFRKQTTRETHGEDMRIGVQCSN
jgi:hypothetical protein